MMWVWREYDCVWRQTNFNLTSIWRQSDVNLTSIWRQSDVNLTSIWRQSDVNLTSIWRESDVSLTWVWRRYDVSMMWVWCESDARLTWVWRHYRLPLSSGPISVRNQPVSIGCVMSDNFIGFIDEVQLNINIYKIFYTLKMYLAFEWDIHVILERSIRHNYMYQVVWK